MGEIFFLFLKMTLEKLLMHHVRFRGIVMLFISSELPGFYDNTFSNRSIHSLGHFQKNDKKTLF